MNIIMLGAPGTGKGTASRTLAKKLNLPHISTGDMFREQIKKQTALGIEAESYISKGFLVPDELTIRIVKDRLSAPDTVNGMILDGFPRTLEQAKKLTEILNEKNTKIDIVPELAIPDEVVIDRIVNRATCSNKECGEIFNLKFKKPKIDGKCDVCGSDLSTRTDDNVESVKQRLIEYYKNSEQLINYYEEMGVLKKICPDDPTADNASDMVVEEIIKLINEK